MIKPTSLDWLSDKPFAHRGLHHAGRGIAENSLTAFRGAAKQQIGIELDVRLSADGEAMVFHDEMLDRLTAERGRMDAHTAHGLSHIRLFGAQDDRISTLTNALAIVRGRVPVLVEMKDCGEQNIRLCIAVRRALEGYGGPIAVMSFNPEIPAWFAKTAPHITRGLVTTDLAPRYGVIKSGGLNHSLNMRRAKAQFIAHDLRCLPSAFVARQRKKAIPTLSWTVRSKTDTDKARAHVDNLIFELETK
ncbi:MAG: glycerophosphodiester phosphodiesterase family protein [Pseudomonadota bacterium]